MATYNLQLAVSAHLWNKIYLATQLYLRLSCCIPIITECQNCELFITVGMHGVSIAPILQTLHTGYHFFYSGMHTHNLTFVHPIVHIYYIFFYYMEYPFHERWPILCLRQEVWDGYTMYSHKLFSATKSNNPSIPTEDAEHSSKFTSHHGGSALDWQRGDCRQMAQSTLIHGDNRV